MLSHLLLDLHPALLLLLLLDFQLLILLLTLFDGSRGGRSRRPVGPRGCDGVGSSATAPILPVPLEDKASV